MERAESKPELLKIYEDKAGHRIEFWKTGAGYQIVVKLDNVVLIQEHYTRYKSAMKRYWWYTTQWVKQPVK